MKWKRKKTINVLSQGIVNDPMISLDLKIKIFLIEILFKFQLIKRSMKSIKRFSVVSINYKLFF